MEFIVLGSDSTDVSRTLIEIDKESAHAAETLLPMLYSELRLLAKRRLAREPAGHSLSATDLVHEVYLRLAKDSEVQWAGKAHFFAAAAEAMRRILIESARRRAGPMRGGGWERVPLEEAGLTFGKDPIRMLALDEALTELERQDRHLYRIVTLRYFVGLSVAETAAMLGSSKRTILREWSFARAWLQQRLSGGHTSIDGEG